ncbi:MULTISPECIES: ATP-binding protein [unclassified Undibacterium]|uniref:ATP-binding protein n=1 Tax=unclassified Undibacterium TaxID=2630295 RepID=UPI002AC9143D|nr:MULTISPECIES: ATP-binding protein [unclassified Undibacterium]MEB0139788.1 ATP-binding protein [Undibacterium sp. CCC2.1]MEB0170504.1 ATP-binding protein [Undibacterium sp. CCC1.1]MEB0174445.1 ATP-binding protein [Undibacterium sp. CCC3.4]MEB0213758.1 ATP-binding protein [Undibacterium sp. 5I2]WPX43921.1 ATP-binding protein [Undibacterium sp. CCC3.4]
MKSLRVQMIVLFGLAMALTAALQFASSFQVIVREANKLFDFHMQQMALALQDGDFQQLNWRTVPGIESNNFDFVVQVWSADGAQVYQSRQYRVLPQQAVLGYSNTVLDNGEWRIYAAQAQGRVIQVAQKTSARRQRAISMAMSSVMPIVPVALLLFAVAWWAISIALAPLTRIGKELAQRSTDSVATVSDAGVPQEVSLLVTELNSLLLRMGRALQSQQRFVADAAHELRSPITAVRLQVQNLGRARDEVSHEQAVRRLLGGVDRAGHLVEQLLALARQDPSSTPLPLHCSLSACAEQALNDVLVLAGSRQIDVHSQLEPDLFIAGESESLRVMIRNLLDNAIRYIPAHGQVTLALTRTPAGILLVVEDSGAGIAAAERSRIFDRFYRVPGTSVSGSGLGLAIVKAIAERHHANITLGEASLGGLAVRLFFSPQS